MLSIIIITKNEERRLPRLLKSVRKQNFKDYEIIVSDAKSTDNTRKIARKFGCKIVDGGIPSVGRNNGAKVARGDILLFLDGDSNIQKGFLEQNLEEFKKRELVIAVPISKPISNNAIDLSLSWIYKIFMLFIQYFSPHGGGMAMFCKSIIFKKTKGFNELRVSGEDHDLIKRCVKYGKFRVLESKPILIDMRRFNKDGRVKTISKYIMMGISELFGVPPTLINYTMQGVNPKEEIKKRQK